MKHLKIYEQYNFEDLSDEELFGEHKHDVIKLRGSDLCYIIERIDERGKIILYNNFDWVSEYLAKELYIESVNPIINSNTTFEIHDEKSGWRLYLFENLPNEIKNMIL